MGPPDVLQTVLSVLCVNHKTNESIVLMLVLHKCLDDEEGVMGVCYFGHIPSPSCMFRCSVRGQAPVCDEDSRCLCEDHTWRQFLTPTYSLSDVGSGKYKVFLTTIYLINNHNNNQQLIHKKDGVAS